MNKVKEEKKLDANFTAGGILYQEFSGLMDIVESKNFNDLISAETENNAFIGIAVESSRKRIITEIKRRYKNAPSHFWSHFKEWNTNEQKLALYYLCLKTYPLIFDIHFEVVIKKYMLGSNLDDYDIQMRFDELASMDADFAQWAEITLYKLNVQIRKALKDAGIYDGEKLNSPREIGTDFWKYFKDIGETWFLKAAFVNI